MLVKNQDNQQHHPHLLLLAACQVACSERLRTRNRQVYTITKPPCTLLCRINTIRVSSICKVCKKNEAEGCCTFRKSFNKMVSECGSSFDYKRRLQSDIADIWSLCREVEQDSKIGVLNGKIEERMWQWCHLSGCRWSVDMRKFRDIDDQNANSMKAPAKSW